jgi:hypothetical protein
MLCGIRHGPTGNTALTPEYADVRGKLWVRSDGSSSPMHLSLCCEVMPKGSRCDLLPYTSRARCPSCGERYHSRAPAGEYHRHICHEFWAARWRVHRDRPVERRSDRQATLHSRRPAAGHRECANHRLGAFIEAVKPKKNACRTLYCGKDGPLLKPSMLRGVKRGSGFAQK